MALVDFSASDLRVLRRLIKDEENRRQNNPPVAEREETTWTPELAILRPPVGGIAALTRDSAVGTADADNNDTPGKATCDLWKIVSDNLEPLSVSSATQKPVYNYSDAKILRDWVLGIKTKFGNWIAIPKGAALIEGTLVADLTAATNSTTDPSVAALNIYVKNEGSGDMEDSGDNENVTNRMTEHDTIVAGTWLVAAQVNGEWRPLVADCAPTTITGT